MARKDWSRKDAFGVDYIEMKGDEGAPVILLLHGFGADNEDLASLSAAYSGKRRPTWILPNGPEKVQIGFFSMGRSWFNIDIAGLQKAFKEKDYDSVQSSFPSEIKEIREKVEGFLRELNIAPHQLIIGGFSQGAVLAIEIALHAFENPLGLLIFSGTLVNKKSWEQLALQKGGVPFLQTHGKGDTILPVELAYQLENLLTTSGLSGKLHLFEGSHEIPLSALNEMDLFLQKLVV